MNPTVVIPTTIEAIDQVLIGPRLKEAVDIVGRTAGLSNTGGREIGCTSEGID
jgi:hypothetical protein